MCWQRLRVHLATVARDVRVHPVFVHVAIEHLAPLAAGWKTDPVIKAVKRCQMHNDDHVVAFPFHPAMKGQHTVLVVNVDHTETLSAQARILHRK